MLATTDLTNSYLIWGMHIFLPLHPVIDSSQTPIGIAACKTGIYRPCKFYCGCFFYVPLLVFDSLMSNIFGSPVQSSPLQSSY